ncbi:phosphatase PAP2 family protein [Streptomyces sp. NPDC001070]
MSRFATPAATTPAQRGLRGPAGTVGLGALAAFAMLTAVVASRHGTPFLVDGTLLSWSTGHRPDVAVTAARLVTATGTGVIAYALAVLAGAVAGRTARQRVIAAAGALGCLVAGQAARFAVMRLVARPRPYAEEWAAHATGFAFPSGHAATSATIAGLLVVAVLLRDPPGRTVLAVSAACWGVAVGLTRVYLGVHWFSDVVGGWLFALAWLGLCLGLAARWLPHAPAGDQRRRAGNGGR